MESDPPAADEPAGGQGPAPARSSREVNVHLLPALTTPQALAGRLVVVIDVLRATTSIVAACGAGAREILPCLEVEEARRLAADLAAPRAGAPQTGRVLLAGERGGLPIPGFDLGNSPAEFTAQRVAEATLVMTTTNGTRAMRHCQLARRVLIGAFSNYSAVCQVLAREVSLTMDGPPPVEILCAGTDGQVTREDVLLAGALVDDLGRQGVPLEPNDQAEIAHDTWLRAVAEMASPGLLHRQLARSGGGRNLIEIGREDDLELAAQLDRWDVVPELDVPGWRIAAGGPWPRSSGPAGGTRGG